MGWNKLLQCVLCFAPISPQCLHTRTSRGQQLIMLWSPAVCLPERGRGRRDLSSGCCRGLRGSPCWRLLCLCWTLQCTLHASGVESSLVQSWLSIILVPYTCASRGCSDMGLMWAHSMDLCFFFIVSVSSVWYADLKKYNFFIPGIMVIFPIYFLIHQSYTIFLPFFSFFCIMKWACLSQRTNALYL